MIVRFQNVLLATSALIPLSVIAALANPLGSQVVGGSANVQGQGTPTVTVTQSTDRAIINWNTFNIGRGETTRFLQPSASSVTLNRVTGNLGPSFLDGTLTANGRIFLVNPDGILFGANSKIDTAGFLATTNDIKNTDLMAGRYQFNTPGRPDASIVNQGAITAQNGGFAALVAPGVRNTGTITANLGSVGLASSNGFSLDFYGDKLITLGVTDSIAAKVIDVSTGQPLDALIKNDGKLKANGGRVELTAVAARQVVDAVINNKGVIEANSIGTKNGMIILGAATSSTKPTGTPTQTVKLSGKLVAAGKRKNTNGGTVVVAGENIQLASATIDASGQAGGGEVLIGGDVGGGNGNKAVTHNPKATIESYAVATASNVNVDKKSTIDASAKSQGDGGKVVLWSDQATTFYGNINARGGSERGNGGVVETSGLKSLTFDGLVDTSATFGKNGTLLLDPLNVTIGSIAGPGVVTTASLQTALANADVVVTTGSTGSEAGNITVDSNVVWANANALTLSAYRNIQINANIANSGGAAVNLRADNTGTGVGTVGFGVGAQVATSGLVSVFYNPTTNPANSIVNSSSYSSPDNIFAGHVIGGPLTAYMLVNSVFDLQNIKNNLFGTYALGKNIDASSTASWNSGKGFSPIGNDQTVSFRGLLNGQGYAIDRLTIIDQCDPGCGLIGDTGPSAVIRDIGLTNVNIFVSPAPYGNWVGALVGLNNGTIERSYVTGSVSNDRYGYTGGLVGFNYGGTISKSYSTATVSGGASVGGLAGSSESILSCVPAGCFVVYLRANIKDSYATGSVLAGTYPAVGGPSRAGALVGYSSDTNIESSYATGQVLLSASGTSGGLAPAVNGSGLISNSYWDVQTTGQSTSAVGVGLTTAQLKSGLPSGFDSTVWAINPAVNSGYPYLKPHTNTSAILAGERPTTAHTSITEGQQFFNNQQIHLLNAVDKSPIGFSGHLPRLDGFPGLANASSPQQLLKDVLPYLKVAAAVYDFQVGNNDGRISDGWEKIAKYEMGLDEASIAFIKSTGFSAAIYQVNGRAVLAFAGTNPKIITGYIDAANDIMSDVLNAAGLGDPQYSFAKQLAAAAEKKYGSSNLILTGHSLGGGLAAYAASTLGVPAITFNPAGLSNAGSYSKVLNFQIGGDFAQAGGSTVGQTIVFDQSLLMQTTGVTFHSNSTPAMRSTSVRSRHGLENFVTLANNKNLSFVSSQALRGVSTFTVKEANTLSWSPF